MLLFAEFILFDRYTKIRLIACYKIGTENLTIGFVGINKYVWDFWEFILHFVIYDRILGKLQVDLLLS